MKLTTLCNEIFKMIIQQNLDHHCILMNTCIGKRNYRFFYLLLFSLMLFNLSIMGFCLTYLLLNTDTYYSYQKIITYPFIGTQRKLNGNM